MKGMAGHIKPSWLGLNLQSAQLKREEGSKSQQQEDGGGVRPQDTGRQNTRVHILPGTAKGVLGLGEQAGRGRPSETGGVQLGKRPFPGYAAQLSSQVKDTFTSDMGADLLWAVVSDLRAVGRGEGKQTAAEGRKH